MIKNNNKVIWVVVFVMLAAVAAVHRQKSDSKTDAKIKIINPAIGDIAVTVSTTGIVKPQNRLEIKPSISGRIEEILVKEGDRVKEGDLLARMSSTERAALVDAARSRGDEALSYWEEVYKKTPIISPIDGEVIVRSVEPGQTVTSSDAVLVLSDRLVVNAQFDETDIGRVKTGQKALITLDAYPDTKIEGVVDHIAYESEIVNNVTIYNVDIIPDDVPEFLRSGMSVTAEVVEKMSSGAVTIPSGAIHYEGNRQFVLIKEKYGGIAERDITVGINNERTAEVTSGLTAEDKVVVQDSAALPKKKSAGTNPFMPSGRR